ncbi:hypothetical protein CRG98_023650 [Punica granatum]|uniref:G-patch domain-containing protein n=1 Tax=Punica granatum TaxID=22663 RepID=A0A2I0JI72_PUNGR|nr:hypothetical protein CRG98_023650 [Punica granatum]
MKRWLCTVDRPSDRDHLFTREDEGSEEPFERDGMTRQSHGRNRHVVEVRVCADLKEPNIAMRRANERSGDSVPRESVSPCSDVRSGVGYVGPCPFSITFQVLDITNAFSLLLGRPWIHSDGAVPSSLHQRLKFIVEEKLITVKGEEDYAIYKETAVPYISVGDDENLPFHSFETISVIRDYGESGPSRADRIIGKVLLHNNYIPGTSLEARGQRISRPIEVEEGTLDGPSSNSDDTPATPSAVYAVTEELPSGVHIRLVQKNEELGNWTSVPRYSAVIADEINVGTEEEPRTLKIRTALDPTQRTRMIDFLKEYQEVFAWSYADMPGLDPSIVEHFQSQNDDYALG